MIRKIYIFTAPTFLSLVAMLTGCGGAVEDNPDAPAVFNSSPYRLPFEYDKSIAVAQGQESTGDYASHNSGNALNRYGIDFAVFFGTKILAARSGKVVKVVENNHLGCANSSCSGQNNEILIEHMDGIVKTYSQYLHLDYNSACVVVGQMVSQGDVIGLTGNTGWSAGPHLHFAVLNSTKNASIPFNFADVQSNNGVPIADVFDNLYVNTINHIWHIYKSANAENINHCTNPITGTATIPTQIENYSWTSHPFQLIPEDDKNTATVSDDRVVVGNILGPAVLQDWFELSFTDVYLKDASTWRIIKSGHDKYIWSDFFQVYLVDKGGRLTQDDSPTSWEIYSLKLPTRGSVFFKSEISGKYIGIDQNSDDQWGRRLHLSNALTGWRPYPVD